MNLEIKNQELIKRYPALNFHRTLERKSKNGETETFFVYRTLWKHADGENYNIEVILPISFIFDRKQDFEITYIRSKDISLTPIKFEEDSNIRNTSRAVSSIATPRINNNNTNEEYQEFLDSVNRVKSGQELDIIFPDLSHYIRNVATPLKGIASSVSYEFHKDRVSKEIIELFYEIGKLNRNSVNKVISEIEKIYEICNFKLRAILAIILNLLKSINIDTQDNFSEIREKIFKLVREIDPSFIVIIPEEKIIEPKDIPAQPIESNDIEAETVDENTSVERCKEIITALLDRTLRIGDREIPFYLQLRIRNEIKIGKDLSILILIIYYLRLVIYNRRETPDNNYYKYTNISPSYYYIRNAENELRNRFSLREIAIARKERQRIYDDRNRLSERIRGCIRKALLAIALASSLSCVAFSCIAAGSMAGRLPIFEIIKDIINRLIGILQNLVQEIIGLIEGLNEFTEEIKIRVLELIQEASDEFKRVIKEGVDNGKINPKDAEIICNQFDLCIDDINRSVNDGDVDGTADKLRNLIDTIKQANPPFLNGRSDSSPDNVSVGIPVSDSVGNSDTSELPYGVEPVDMPFDPEISFNYPLSPADSFNKLGVKVSLRSHNVNGEDVIVLVAYDKKGNLTNVPSEVGLYSFGNNGELQRENSNSVDIDGIRYFYTSKSSAASVSPYGRHGLVP